MFCRNCGRDLAGTPEVCINCGAKPMAGTSFCPGCGAPTTSLTEICTNCGVQVGKAIKERTWKPTAAGILCIVAGTIGVLSGIVVVFHRAALYPFGFLIIVPIVAIVPIVGGIYALRKQNWGLALAGSICTLILGILMAFVVVMALNWVSWIGQNFYYCMASSSIALGVLFSTPGILAIIFVSSGKREFQYGARLLASTGFCPRCGAPATHQTKVCTNCGAPINNAIKRKTWKPTVAGILCVVGGAAWLVPSILLAYLYAVVGSGRGTTISIVAIIAIVGGIYALRRRIWGLSLTGSICTLILEILMPLLWPTFFGEGYYNCLTSSFAAVGVVFGIPGILAIIFVSLGKREFK